MMVKWVNDDLLQANEGKLLDNDGEMLVNDGDTILDTRYHYGLAFHRH